MRKAKITECIASLSEEELNAFKLYMENAIQKKDSPAYKLFSILIKLYPDFNETFIERKKVFSKIFKNEPFNENKLFKLQTELTKYFEQFILTYYYFKDAIKQQFDLLCFYQQKNLDKYFSITLREIKDTLNKLPESSIKYWYKYRIEEQLVIYNQKNDERQTDYQPVIDTVFEFSETELLRWKNISATNLFTVEAEHHPTSLLYFAHNFLHALLNDESEENFHNIYQWSDKYLDKFEKEYAREILIGQINFCIKKINRGDLPYYRHALNVFNLCIRLNVITDPNGFITVATYKNYITTALKLGETQIAKKFLDAYHPYLDPVFAEEVYAFNKANIAFEEKKYDDVSILIININFKDIFYKLNARRLLAKTYFELSKINATYFELQYNTLNAFKKHIYTLDGLPEVYLDANKNFINFTLRLSNVAPDKKQHKLKILNEIKSCGRLAEREWLMEKCAE